MAFLPDTNIWISLLKNPGGYSKPRFSRNLSRRFFLCSVAKAKLRHGAEEYGNRERRQRALEMLFAPFTSLPFDDAAARRYAAIRHHLEVQGRVMGPNDLKFAAIALSQGLTLVSADQQFSRVPGLSLLDWTSG